MIIALGIAILLAFAATGTMTNAMTRLQLQAAGRVMNSALLEARRHSLINGEVISVCAFSTERQHCDIRGSALALWRGDLRPVKPAAGQLLALYHSPPGNGHFQARGGFGRPVVQFTGGIARLAGSLFFCLDNQQRRLVLSPSGRVRDAGNSHDICPR